MKFILGIGNSGEKYARTRHNVAWRVLDALAGSVAPDVKLVKPTVFVNDTGRAVAEIVNRSGAKLEEILVVCDDANLDFGKLRLRASGGAGGHHGLESIRETVASEDFPRLRFGIRTADMPDELPDWVLAPFTKSEEERLPELVTRAAAVCRAWAERGFPEAQIELSRLFANG